MIHKILMDNPDAHTLKRC